MRGRGTWALIALLLPGCAASTPAPPSGVPGVSAPASGITADPSLTSQGKPVWTQSLPPSVSGTRQLDALGDRWVLTGTTPGQTDRMSQVVGSTADGRIRSTLTYGRAVGFPTTGGPDPRPITVGVQTTRRPDVFIVRAWRTDGARPMWRTPVVGAQPRASVRVAGLAGGVVLVRPSVPDQGVFQLSGLVALRQRDGEPAWTFPAAQRLRSVTPGPLITVAYRTDEQRDGPINRVAFLSPKDGSVLGETDWLDYRNHFRPAAVAVSKDRVLLRGDRDNAADIHVALARRDGNLVWHRRAVAEPAVDFDEGVVAIRRPNGSIVGLDLLRGTRLWRWTPQQVAGARAELGTGAYGIFWGNTGPARLVVDSGTGSPLFTGSLSPNDPSNWNGAVLVAESADGLTGFHGAGVPIGVPGAAGPADPIFVQPQR